MTRRPANHVAATQLLVLLGLLGPSLARAGDWPQWRCDANRSAATSEPGPIKATRLWSRSLPHPDPAYDHQYRMCADISYAPIAAEGLLFLPSNVTDQVTAVDLSTGEVRWRYIAEGPVRSAPVYVDGKICFGSDDGYLVCLSARDGRLLWKVRGVPEELPDSRLLVNGRLCSRWPVRGAPVADGGVVMFGAGVAPEEGVYVSAVKVDSGELLWRSDSMSFVKDGMSDHGRAYDLSLPPQGYLAVIDRRLAVPSGRSLAAWFDPATGKMEPYTCFYVKHNPPRGTWYLSGIGHYAVQGGNWFGTRADAAPPLPAELEESAKSALFWSRTPGDNELYVIRNRPFLRADTYLLHPENLYIEPVLTSSTMYASEFVDEQRYLVPRGHTRVKFPEYDRIVARDLTQPKWHSVVQMHVAYGKRKVTMPRLEFPLLWELASPLRVLIKAGDQLFAGGENTIAAVAIPQAGQEPRITWQAEVHGRPVEALVADGKLVVVTHNGTVTCFADERGAGVTEAAAPAVADGPDVRHLSRRGYALVFGSDGADEAVRLAVNDRLRVVILEPDGKKAEAARRWYADQQLGAALVQVLHGDPVRTKLTPYWANRVVVASLDGFESPKWALSAALDAMRPYTGMLQIPTHDEYARSIRELAAERYGYTVDSGVELVTVRRTTPPDGADNWTHESGGPGNCYANRDELVKWPLGVLWYSGTIDRRFTPDAHFQHERHPFPLVRDGRMFIITGAVLHAVDIYTGEHLWRIDMPMTPWVETRNFDSRMYGRPTERNCVVADDWIYLVLGESIHAYDVVTGRQRKVLEIPDTLQHEVNATRPAVEVRTYQGHRGTVQSAPQWTEVRLHDDYLIALLGKTLVAVDRHAGKLRWARPSTRQTTTCALSDSTLFGFDCDIPQLTGGDAKQQQHGLLFALDPESGETMWQQDVAFDPVPRYTLQAERLWLQPIIPLLAYNQKHALVVLAVNRNGIHVFHSSDGSHVWSKKGATRGDLQRVYPPLITDDHLLISNYDGYFGYLLDIVTGAEVGDDTALPQPRTCARVIGNSELLVYRDAATEFYDVAGNRMIGLNSLRSGCTTSFIPAGGVMTAPMLGHGCVCNYPMFSSLGLYHFPEIEKYRPAAVVASWVNEVSQAGAGDKPDATGRSSLAERELPAAEGWQLVNATLNVSDSVALFSTKDEQAGYAVRRAKRPLNKAEFRLVAGRAQAASGQRRHGNVFFVCGRGTEPRELIECRLYYGGRSSMLITGPFVEQVEEKVSIDRGSVFEMIVSVDCDKRTISFEFAGQKLSTRITGRVEAITHYGYGGANSDNQVSQIEVR